MARISQKKKNLIKGQIGRDAGFVADQEAQNQLDLFNAGSNIVESVVNEVPQAIKEVFSNVPKTEIVESPKVTKKSKATSSKKSK